MSYDKQAWANGPTGGTPITAARLGHIEDGIEAAAATADAVQAGLASKASSTDVAALDTRLDTAEGDLTGRLSDSALRAAFGAVTSVKSYGAKGDGVADDTTAIQAALTATAGGSVFVPAGTYLISAELALPETVNLTLDPGATIRATAAMTAMLSTPVPFAQVALDRSLIGGIWDCNNLADDGIVIGYVQHYRIESVTVQRAQRYGFRLGGPGQTAAGYEVMMLNCHSIRPDGTLQPGSAGLYISDRCTDNSITNCVFMGSEVGVSVNSNGNTFTTVHPWTRAAVGMMTTGFDDNGLNNTYLGCYADTPSQYGFRLRQNGRHSIIGCYVYNNPTYGTDNTMVAVHADASNAAFTATGNRFVGTSTTRIKRDFELNATGLGGAQIWGNNNLNVVTATSPAPISTLTNSTGAVTLDATLYDRFWFNQPTGDVTVSFTGGSHGKLITVVVYQGATPRALTWPANTRFTGGVAPKAETMAAFTRMAVTFISDGAGATWIEVNRSGTAPSVRSSTVYTISTLTQAAYDALATKDANTLYVIEG